MRAQFRATKSGRLASHARIIVGRMRHVVEGSSEASSRPTTNCDASTAGLRLVAEVALQRTEHALRGRGRTSPRDVHPEEASAMRVERAPEGKLESRHADARDRGRIRQTSQRRQAYASTRPHARVFRPPEQRRLMEVYERNAYPSRRSMEALAQELDKPPVKVVTWFNNRRARDRRAAGRCAREFRLSTVEHEEDDEARMTLHARWSQLEGDMEPTDAPEWEAALSKRPRRESGSTQKEWKEVAVSAAALASPGIQRVPSEEQETPFKPGNAEPSNRADGEHRH
ncbi:hypothetical protein CDCA_CDCA12G3481 [Cyanidium caldarium]|uniref:Homeobox domain-containing protein n=1 Tax=Cyanidium caldarium TaxID=2771 RepID=A0AAV9IZA0_CYACA|nr:hypothetical protein CDCA_CDCA12G3481 [Cyanidium caldarium]